MCLKYALHERAGVIKIYSKGEGDICSVTNQGGGGVPVMTKMSDELIFVSFQQIAEMKTSWGDCDEKRVLDYKKTELYVFLSIAINYIIVR